MFKRRDSQPVENSGQELSWESDARAVQEFWVSVREWNYKVFPSRQTGDFGSWSFQFEGEASAGPLKGFLVSGEIEVLERNETPGMLSEHWKSVPEHVEGFVHLVTSSDKSIRPFVGLTLYCQASAIDWVYRAFSTASQGRAGGLGVEVRIDCPNNEGGNFWSTQWQQEWLRVVSWKLYAGAKLK